MASADGRTLPLRNTKLRAANIEFTVDLDGQPATLRGIVNGDRMQGRSSAGTEWTRHPFVTFETKWPDWLRPFFAIASIAAATRASVSTFVFRPEPARLSSAANLPRAQRRSGRSVSPRAVPAGSRHCRCRRRGSRRGLGGLRRAQLQLILAHRQQQVRIVPAMAIADPEIERRRLGFLEQLAKPRLTAAGEYRDRPEIGAERLEVPGVRPERRERNSGVVLHDLLRVLQHEVADLGEVPAVHQIGRTLEQAVAVARASLRISGSR